MQINPCNTILYNCLNIRLTSSGGGILYRIGLRADIFCCVILVVAVHNRSWVLASLAALLKWNLSKRLILWTTRCSRHGAQSTGHRAQGTAHRARGTEHGAQGAGHRERTASGVRPAACGQRRGEYEGENGGKGDEETTRRLYHMDPLRWWACPAQRGVWGGFWLNN